MDQLSAARFRSALLQISRPLRARLPRGQPTKLRLGQVEDPLRRGPTLIFLEQGEPLGPRQHVAGSGQPPRLFQTLVDRHRTRYSLGASPTGRDARPPRLVSSSPWNSPVADESRAPCPGEGNILPNRTVALQAGCPRPAGLRSHGPCPFLAFDLQSREF